MPCTTQKEEAGSECSFGHALFCDRLGYRRFSKPSWTTEPQYRFTAVVASPKYNFGDDFLACTFKAFTSRSPAIVRSIRDNVLVVPSPNIDR
jgi:hypothetical protein